MRSVRCISVLSISIIRVIRGNCIHLFYLPNLLRKQLSVFIRAFVATAFLHLSINIIRVIRGNCIHLLYLPILLCKQLPAFIRELRGNYNPVFINRIYPCIRG